MADRPYEPPDVDREPQFYLQLNETQCTELSFGRIPGEVQEMAQTLVDWTLEDLRRNVAKPVKLSKVGRS